jgi:type IV pilus assembly protein PilB
MEAKQVLSPPKSKKKRLGEILIAEGVIDDLQLARALGDQKQWGGKLGEILLRMKLVTEEDLAYALQANLRVKWLSLKEVRIPEAIIKLVPEDLAKKFMVVPVALKKTALYIATTDPTDLMAIDTISFNIGMMVKPVIATQSDIKWALARYYDKTVPEEPVPAGQVYQAEAAAPQAKDTALKKRMERKASSNALKGLISLLIEKSVITQDELAEKISELDDL